jgi:hypothetical protein
MGGEEAVIEMPDVSAPFMLTYLFDVGPVRGGGMGPVPLVPENLIAWQQETGIELQPWQSHMLRRLSRDYLIQLNEAEDQKCQPPWVPQNEKHQSLRQVAMSLKAAIRAI